MQLQHCDTVRRCLPVAHYTMKRQSYQTLNTAVPLQSTERVLKNRYFSLKEMSTFDHKGVKINADPRIYGRKSAV